MWDAIQAHQSPDALYLVLLKPWLEAMGGGEWATRLPSAVAGAVAVGLTCILGTRLLGRAAGLVAAGVLGTAVLVVEWSQRGDGVALGLAGIVGATVALVAALERPSWWRWGLWGLAAAIAVGADLLMATVLLAHGAAFATRRPRPEWRTPAVALALVAVVALTSTALILTSDARHVGGLQAPPGGTVVDGLWRLAGLTPIPLAVAGLGVFVLVTSRVPGAEHWQTTLLVTWLVAPVAVGVLVSFGRPAFDPGYAIAAVPALALLVAAGVVSQEQRIAFALVALLVVGAGVRLVLWYGGPSVEDWRGAVRAIQAEQRAGEAVLVLPERTRVAAAVLRGRWIRGRPPARPPRLAAPRGRRRRPSPRARSQAPAPAALRPPRGTKARRAPLAPGLGRAVGPA